MMPLLASRSKASLLLISALSVSACGGRGTLYADADLSDGDGGTGTGASDTGGTSSGGGGTGGVGGTESGGAPSGGAPPTGGSTGRPCASNAPCDDFDACTADFCAEGFCRHVENIDDGDPCTLDFCVPARGPAHVLAADDDNLCTYDLCEDGVVRNPPVDLDDGDPCTVDFCDPAIGVVHTLGNLDDDNACTVDYCDGKLGVIHQPVVVDDKNACTVDSCDPLFGPLHTEVLCDADACSIAKCDPLLGCISEPRGCIDDDGCCNAGCTANNDNDCCGVNLALSAVGVTPAGSGTGFYGPAQLNNGLSEADDCTAFSWVKSTPGGPVGTYFEYDWPSPVTIRSIYVDTQNGLTGGCNPAGRNLKSGSVQYWTGSTWATATSFANQHDDLAITLPSPVTTTRLRLMDVTTDIGNGNSLIHEWYVYGAAGCMP